jgi:radical SAM protein with 4Fe4S-binding SPASM domain
MRENTTMQMRIDGQTLLRAPATVVERAAGAAIAIDPASPNWIATDDRGLMILRRLDGKTPFDEVVRAYAADTNLDFARAWLHVETFARDALRQKFISTDGAVPLPYLGRSAYLRTDRLRELWIQVSDFCNLSCEHCLVSSGPQGGQGLPGPVLQDVINQAVGLGTERFFITGGEPLARKDILEIITNIVVAHQRELVLLTNGTVFKGGRLEALAALPPDRLRIQISLDGASPDVNDPIRGRGSFERICEGVRLAIAAGLRTTLTMVLLRHNLGNAEAVVRLAADLGVSNVHLLWPHRRGRVLEGQFSDLPSAAEILEAVRKARTVARDRGVTIDNVEELRLRFDGASGTKNDLAGAGWTSLCLYTDGAIYPSASMAGVAELRCGSVLERSLDDIWKNSSILRELRATTVDQKTQCRPCHLKFLCGGGDFEHGYWASGASGGAGFTGHDPYCGVYQGLAADTFAALADEGRRTVQPRSGFDRPVVLRGMGERTLHEPGSRYARSARAGGPWRHYEVRAGVGCRARAQRPFENPAPRLRLVPR